MMRVLMVSPHPVYSPRGTPISVFNRCQALCALGHEVDLVTYPIGEDLPVDGLRYLRATLPGVHKVAVGPSFAKFLLNGATTVRAFREAVRGHYDVVHTHEEAGLFGPALARMCRVPHVYDMGNDWADVLRNYGVGHRNPLTVTAASLENAVIRHSDAVIAHFPLIADRVVQSASTPVETVFNISLEADPDPALASYIRASWAAERIEDHPLLGDPRALPGRAAPVGIDGRAPPLASGAGGRRAADPSRSTSCRSGPRSSASPTRSGCSAPSPPRSYRPTSWRPTSWSPPGSGDATLRSKSSPTSVRGAPSWQPTSPATPRCSTSTPACWCGRRPPDSPPGSKCCSTTARSAPGPSKGRGCCRAEFGIERYVRGVARAYEFVGGAAVDEAAVSDAAGPYPRRRQRGRSLHWPHSVRRHERADPPPAGNTK